MGDQLRRLVGQIQNYAWGGHSFIPNLLGIEPEPGTPYAEYWLGAHRKAPARVVTGDGERVPLNAFIAEHPQQTLGPRVASQYGRLPYLFKVLDVAETLSIQVHPTKAQAEAGFERENERGIPLDAPNRNYKDRNHKPELMVALSDFWLLHGFLPEAQLLEVLDRVLEFDGLRRIFEEGGYAGLYEHVMTLPADRVDARLAPLARRLRAEAGAGALDEATPDYWAAQVLVGHEGKGYDRGVFSIYFCNLIKLTAGQGIFQDAGILHAYLRGQNVEVMANSDNVLRGGLTPKHVDVPELLDTVQFEGISPAIIEGIVGEECPVTHYPCPVRDFHLSRLHLGPDETYVHRAESIEILLVMDGAVVVEGNGERLSLARGESIVTFGSSRYGTTAPSGPAVLCRVSVP
jgi:mannose-6-phosphate isomerase